MIKYFVITILLCQIGYAKSLNVPIDKNMREVSVPKILQYANTFIGCSYGYGYKNKQKIDCSGFVQEVFTHFGIFLPRSVFEQSHIGQRIDFKHIQSGDLLFFSTHKSVPSHVAIYLGNRKIIHASYAAKCVHYDTIDKTFYRKNFLFAKRLFVESMHDLPVHSHSNSIISNKEASKQLYTKKNIVPAEKQQVNTELVELGETNRTVETVNLKNSMIFPLPQKKFRNYQIFEGRDIIISKEGQMHLSKWAQLFKVGGYKSVIVNVYTDNLPPRLMQARFATNLILSEARAKMISDYLILQGIDSNSIQVHGMGDNNPISSNETAEGQSKNRRIEFIF